MVAVFRYNLTNPKSPKIFKTNFFKDFTLVAPIRKFHYIPDRRHTKIERAFIPPFDALDHLLSRRDYPVNLTQPTITIYHDSKKRTTDSQVERKFKKLRV